jgi:small subunit ribosomal protein S15
MYLLKRLKKRSSKHGEKQTLENQTQIALFTFRLAITEHLKKNRHDYNTERSLVLLVGKRRSLLDYLKEEINISLKLSKY